MRLVTFSLDNSPRPGVVLDELVVDLSLASDGQLPGSIRALLDMGPPALDTVQRLLSQLAGQALEAPLAYPLSSVRLLAPIPDPSKIVAIGLNYMDHCREQNIDPPKFPLIFAKFPSSVIGPGQAISWDPSLTQKVDFEAELAVVIGRTARRVPAAEALSYVAGYTICNDVSARDLQSGDRQWVRGKSMDTFCPMGPYLVTADEVGNPQQLAIRSTLNGRVFQASSTSEMIFKIPTLIEFASQAFTLNPGDLIATGTPSGVGVFRDPPIFLKAGDTVSIEIEKLGTLTNPVAGG